MEGNGGPAAAMRELEGQLIVTQTKDNHRQLINLLAATPRSAIIQARSLSATEVYTRR